MQDQFNLLKDNVDWLINLHNSFKKTNCNDTEIQLLNLHQINSELEKELSVLTLRLEEKYENLSLNNINLQDNTCYEQLEKCKDKLIKLNSLLVFCERNKITLEKQILTLKSNNTMKRILFILTFILLNQILLVDNVIVTLYETLIPKTVLVLNNL